MLSSAGIDISIATMVHAANLADFDELESIVKDIGAKEWSIDAPSQAGRWAENGALMESDHSSKNLAASPELAGSVFDRAFGGGAHFSGVKLWEKSVVDKYAEDGEPTSSGNPDHRSPTTDNPGTREGSP